MQLSIRDASRFVIGAALIRAQAIEASASVSAEDMTFDNVAVAILQENADGEKLRRSVDILASRESAWFRSTPPHILSSERVMQSRAAEASVFRLINAAVVSTVENAALMVKGDTAAADRLQHAYMAAYEAMDVAPGSVHERRTLKNLLYDQASKITPHADAVGALLASSEKAYLEADADAILSRYENGVERSSDFDI